MSRVLAVTLGDRYGVGPELVGKLIGAVTPEAGVIVGDPAVLGIDLPPASSFGDAPNGWSLLARRTGLPAGPMGQMSPEAGREMLDTLGFVADAAGAGEIGGIVYAPLNKQAMKAAGHAAGDELAFLEPRFNAPGMTGEINILGELWTSRVTSHVPLGQVAPLITRERVGAGIELLARALERAGRSRPRLAVAALNPHAGEGGAFGTEEIAVLTPTIADARARGRDVEGPFPSDTIFPRAATGAFDGVVTMYHDQGQIALKMIGLGQGITLLAGFPVPMATPGHGVAYDIAGKGIARPDGMIAAAQLVLRMMGQ